MFRSFPRSPRSRITSRRWRHEGRGRGLSGIHYRGFRLNCTRGDAQSPPPSPPAYRGEVFPTSPLYAGGAGGGPADQSECRTHGGPVGAPHSFRMVRRRWDYPHHASPAAIRVPRPRAGTAARPGEILACPSDRAILKCSFESPCTAGTCPGERSLLIAVSQLEPVDRNHRSGQRSTISEVIYSCFEVRSVSSEDHRDLVDSQA